MQRIIIGLVVGSGVTFLLFVVMAYLIKADSRPPLKVEAISIQMSMVEPDDDINSLVRRVPKKPEKPKNPPPPQTQRIAKAEKPKIQSMNLTMGKIDVSVAGSLYMGPRGGAMGDGEAIPMVIIQPRYPRKAAMDGIEGWVKFKFTISADGTPKDVEMVDAKPRRMFEKDARRAIYKWKFKPKIVDGKAMEQKNMVYTMVFQLAPE